PSHRLCRKPPLFGQFEAMIDGVAKHVINRIGDAVDYHFVELRSAPFDHHRHQLPKVPREATRQPSRASESLSERHHTEFDQSLFQLEELSLEAARAHSEIESLASAEAGGYQDSLRH